MKRNIVLILLLILPLYIWSQVVSCQKRVLKSTRDSRTEMVDYHIRIFEFVDSTMLMKTMQLLSIAPVTSSISLESKKVKSILTMTFVRENDSTWSCDVCYSGKPFMYDDLWGCCLISDQYVQLAGDIPSFLTSTKQTASFSYLSHKLIMGGYKGKTFEIEEMGDDSVPRWKLEYCGCDVRLSGYWGP